MASNTKNGKAFEYACLKAICEKLLEHGKNVQIDDSVAYRNTVKDFNSLSKDKQKIYMDAAKAAAKIIFPLEPTLEHGLGELFLAINPDSAAQGENGDVRDVLCIRSNDNENWEIGLSCKHNHAALKHPRITADKDFGKSWVGLPNSSEFIDEISSTIDSLIEFTKQRKPWKEIAPTQEEKHTFYYLPIIRAYKNEITRMCEKYPETPQKLLSYFFGSKDFYKVIMNERDRTTTLIAFNMNNSLGRKCGRLKSRTPIRTTNMPTRLIETDFKRDKKGTPSKTTIILRFDSNWTVSMRLHNKDKIVRLTSLAWDVQLDGFPSNAYYQIQPWYENE